MTDEQRPPPEGETEVLPVVAGDGGLARTQELPAVPGPAPDATVRLPPPAPPEPRYRPPAAPTAPVARPRAGIPPALVTLAVLLVIGVGAALVLRDRGAAPGSASAVALPVTVSSLDPSGGSGFEQQDGTWRTQTYATAAFGGLKDGVGLLLDLGAARAVGAVTFEVAGGPVTAELRAGDDRSATATGYARVTGPAAASGATTLTASGGGRHRYWLVWVTRLAAAGGGGYRATVQSPAPRGPGR